MSHESQKQVRIGVAGAGVFGRNHANKIRANGRAELVGIYDLSASRAEALAEELGTKAFTDLSALLAHIDALVVATPAVAHGGVARAAIDAGKHCLVEKPLAATAEDADILCDHAAQRRVVLQAGHQERYIFSAMGLFDVAARPNRLDAVRVGLPSLRGADVSATLDLMVHDIDLARLLFRADPVQIHAKRLAGQPENPDAVEAVLTFPGGGEARFLASRAAEERDRRMTIEYAAGTVSIDFIAKEFKDGPGFGLHADFATRIPDPMGAATADFIAAILGEKPVVISAADGAAAVRIAETIDQATRA
ncbi:glucose-6-phosphate 3-dehydrogenase [Candidatus Phycosocius bacilliformis]|uniref:Glucose-6-phosphate 3-dehydrogenase n=1 Tax=Candidatus Phycosocius bacilliformis TaxID=1445552 RepID=A0A2P2E6K1_9PROT|nr:Gfo/Idh/MocA family oxidoreductase [Candidatus Phycosocius bacilliformis]GBF56669.1 glucose-6-phosphate 3-dehydrogenase [Candidatus Phycosocius bacilliformis]